MGNTHLMYSLPIFFVELCILKDLSADENIKTPDIWNNEKECLNAICLCIARTYSVSYSADEWFELNQLDQSDYCKNYRWMVEHCIFSTLKDRFICNKHVIKNRFVVELCCIKELYKIFERC